MPQYQGVWTLEQQAQAQSNQQWVTDPNFKNTTLLLQADGAANGAQNNLFLDTSSNQFAITRNGNTTQGSFSPFSQAPGYWSNYFVGASNNSLTYASSAGVAFGTGDFSIEVFGFANSFPTLWRILAFPSAAVCNIEQGTGAGVGINFGAGNVNVNTTLPLSQWFHLAITRQSGVARVFLNGQLTYTAANTTNYSTSQVVYAGGYVGFNQSWDGFLSNLRIQKGSVPTAYQTSSTTIGAQIFNPPTSNLTSDGNTSILSCQSNRFVDNSASPLAITVTGSPSVQAFGPFAPALQWTPDVVGGSGYFDGSGDYLTCSVSASPTGTQNFTIEGWIYVPTTNTEYAILDNNNSSGGFYLRVNTSGQINVVQTNTVGILTSTTSIKANSWNYFCVTRSGNTFNIYLNSTSVDSTTSSSVSFSTGTSTVIGAYYNGALNFTGYMSSLRVVIGTATAPTSVPTAPLTAVANTQLLLNYTNAGIYDGTMNTSWETVNSAQVSTNPVKYGSGSVYFNGTSSQRLLPSQLYPQLTPGTGDFTIECWLYIIGKNATTSSGIIDYRPGVNGTYINWLVDFGGYSVGSATAPKLVLYTDSAVFISSNVISIGQWNHVALCRANSVTRMFINGVLASTPTADTKNYGSGGSAGNYRPSIGSQDGGDSLYGYIDDFRISRFARYIANFTPPQQALPRQ